MPQRHLSHGLATCVALCINNPLVCCGGTTTPTSASVLKPFEQSALSDCCATTIEQVLLPETSLLARTGGHELRSHCMAHRDPLLDLTGEFLFMCSFRGKKRQWSSGGTRATFIQQWGRSCTQAEGRQGHVCWGQQAGSQASSCQRTKGLHHVCHHQFCVAVLYTKYS